MPGSASSATAIGRLSPTSPGWSRRWESWPASSTLALELGDVLFVLLALANEQKVDMTAAFREVLEKYRTRDAERWQRP